MRLRIRERLRRAWAGLTLSDAHLAETGRLLAESAEALAGGAATIRGLARAVRTLEEQNEAAHRGLTCQAACLLSAAGGEVTLGADLVRAVTSTEVRIDCRQNEDGSYALSLALAGDAGGDADADAGGVAVAG